MTEMKTANAISFLPKASILLIILLNLQACGTRVPEVERLSVKGTVLVDEAGDTVALRGISFGWHNLWPRFYTEEVTELLVDEWGAEVIRASCGVGYMKGWDVNPELGTSCVSTVVDAAIRKGAYAIIDWHAHDPHTDAAKEFFTQMVGRYKGYPNVIYELFNEPDYETWDEVKAHCLPLIDIIRSQDPEALILIGCPHWDQDVHLVADDPITGYDNIMYTLHFYAGTHGAELRERADYALSKGLPLFVSECASMEATGNGPLNLNSWAEWTVWMQGRDVSYVMWSVSDKDESCSMLYPTASPQGGWSDNDLKEWGLKAREELKNKIQ